MEASKIEPSRSFKDNLGGITDRIQSDGRKVKGVGEAVLPQLATWTEQNSQGCFSHGTPRRLHSNVGILVRGSRRGRVRNRGQLSGRSDCLDGGVM